MLSRMIITSHGIAFEAHTGLAKQFGGHAQITLGAGDVHMAKIGRQLRQQTLHIRAIAVPANQAGQCEAVTKVV